MDQPYDAAEEWVEVCTRRWSKFDRVSVAACVLLGGAVLAIAACLVVWEFVFPYLAVGVAAAGVAAVTAFSIRFAVFGKLPPNVFDSLPRQITHAAIYWLVVKFGILGATLYLLLAAGIGLFLRWPVAFLVQAFVLLALVMMIGNLIQSCAVNISLVLRRLGRPQDNI